jgi:transcriptional regulator with XRE-family HTH domain
MFIGEYIKVKRKENRLSQKDLANELSIGQSYLSQIESGNKMPSQELLADLAFFFKIPFGAFMLLSIEKNKVDIKDWEKFDKATKLLSEVRFSILLALQIAVACPRMAQRHLYRLTPL